MRTDVPVPIVEVRNGLVSGRADGRVGVVSEVSGRADFASLP
ncbi:hypothetical protein AKJ09_03006 [Labilithrix luteola]|uniref:Uncharacterized protein n=1 Tax=Labilithrix luteola TaxID=1391654 RepID=A0A0K1PS48_9BACT|nr:hypothetical protein AKJ09_03006 [Labilithrix luteola]